VPLDHASARRRRRASGRWYRPAREPLAPEPGRLVVCALLSRARRARGCSTPGDDRLETRVYAVKRYAYRLGHAARSARFATSLQQLVVGLAPVMGWGPVPRGKAERARFVRAHRRSVQRWLDDLQEAGLVEHEPEKDGDGLWWRTQLVLLAAPEPCDVELRVASCRARAWALRERRRRRRGSSSLGAIRARSAIPSAAAREAAARRRASRLLAHPFGAPPSSADCKSSAQPLKKYGTVVDRTGARLRGLGPVGEPANGNGCIAEIAGLSRDDSDALVERLLAARSCPSHDELQRAHASARVAEVTRWPLGRVCPLGRLREAWTAQRYGLARVVESGAADAGTVRAPLVGRAIRLYEAHRAHRPPGWPESGAAALCVLGSQRRATRLTGDLSRLLTLAKAMRAAAFETDAARLDRARARAADRERPAPTRLAGARWETCEQRRRRVRDAVLLAGGNPAAWPNAELALGCLPGPDVALVGRDLVDELDGYGARAARFRAELGRGLWDLPSSDSTDLNEGAPR
jgi:hypothetical protein